MITMTFETTVKINCACMNIDIVTTVNWTNHADEIWAYEHPANLIVSIAYCYRSCMVHWECMIQYSKPISEIGCIRMLFSSIISLRKP